MGLKEFYNGRKVFVTGHTGFKGSWLCWFLLELGADVTGYALSPEDIRGNLYKQTDLGKAIKSIEGNINDLKNLQKSIDESGAEILFHLAAQPIVLRSYKNPIDTYKTNTIGTVNILEVARLSNAIKTVIIITTDKCYENREWLWGYRETDSLGGHDPYSSSKAMAELAVSSYRKSFLAERGIGVATARAGNVIGGGDFGAYRIIPDIAEAISRNESVVLRNPGAIRPWQHVLDALNGYLLLGKKLRENSEEFATSFNFSPEDNSNDHTVLYITKKFINIIGSGRYEINEATQQGHEASYLRLDASRAKSILGWKSVFKTDEAIAFTAEWYKSCI